MRFKDWLNGNAYTPPSSCFADGDPPPAGGGDPPKPELPAWLNGAALNEHQSGLLQKKAWNKDTPVTAVLDAYINAEKALGSDKIALPKGDNDQAGWDAIFKAAGRPDAPDKYTFKLPDTYDKDFVGGFKEVAHKAGIGDKQANALATWFAESGQKAVATRQAEADAKNELELTQVKAEQGANYGDYTKVGLAAATALKLAEADIDKLEGVLGTKRTLDMLYAIGQGMKEGKFTSSDTGKGGGGAMTPEEAKREIARLRTDREWQKKYQQGDMGSRERWKALHAWAYPE